MALSSPRRLLIIKLGALGDFAQSFAAFEAIRQHYPDAHITLLTTKPYGSLAEQTGYFNSVWTGGRPAWSSILTVIRLFVRVRQEKFDWVFDLQNSSRTRKYYYLMGGRSCAWNSAVSPCSHPHKGPKRLALHVVEDLAKQLCLAGVDVPKYPALGWLPKAFVGQALPKRYALIEPGSSPEHPEKRWPISYIISLCEWLLSQGITPVLDGGSVEIDLCAAISAAVPKAINISGKTSMVDIMLLAKNAVLVVGGDTGPMHLAALAGGRCISLFSSLARPERSAPWGRWVYVLQSDDLKDLLPEAVIKRAKQMLEVKREKILAY